MPDAPAPFPAPLAEFIACIERGEYWRAHEVLEGLWRETRSGFHKGLILAASAWVHVLRDNPRGVWAQLLKAERELAPFPPEHEGIDVAALRATVARGLEALEHPDWRGRMPRLEVRRARPEPGARSQESGLGRGETER